MTQKRNVSLDLLRIFAIFLVAFNHSEENGFWLYAQYEPSTIRFWFYMFCSIFCKAGVPLFLMVSGAVMLDRKPDSMKKLWGQRIARMIIVLLLFSFLYYALKARNAGETIQLASFLKATYGGPQFGHLWYLYIYIAYLICLPFLQSMVQNLDNHFFGYMVILSILFDGILPIFECLVWNNEVTLYRMSPWILTNIILYPMLGYYFFHKAETTKWQNGKILGALWGLSFLAVALSAVITWCSGSKFGGFHTERFFQLFIIVPCIAIMVSVKQIGNREDRIGKVIGQLGMCTFGVYLIHYSALNNSIVYGVRNMLVGYGFPPLLTMLMLCVIVLVACYGVIYVLRCIPFVRKII